MNNEPRTSKQEQQHQQQSNRETYLDPPSL